jgi:hypothetical protein
VNRPEDANRPPNDASRQRLTLAREVAPAYGDLDEVAAVIVGGSVARGCADRYSDLELGVFWNHAPSDEGREQAAARAGALHRRNFPYEPATRTWDEEYEVTGLKIDVQHMTVESVEHVLTDVTERFDPAVPKQVLVGTLRHAIPLAGTELVERWRARTAYPDGLALATVRAHLAFGPQSYLEMLAARDDWLRLDELFCRVARLLLGVLLGLNRIYPPASETKWFAWTIAQLPIAPPALAERLRQAFRSPPSLAVADLGRLVDETLALVEAHLPEVETTAVRQRIAQRRGPWDDEPAV